MQHPPPKSVLGKLLAGMLMLASSACGDSEDPVATFDAGPTPLAGEGCPQETPVFAYGDNGLEVSDADAGVYVRLLEASVTPPVKGENDWTIGISDATGAPLDAAQITWACSYMPEHGHGAFPKAIVQDNAGRFDLEKLNLFMEGGWEVQLWVDPDGGSEAFDPRLGSQLEPCREPSGARPNIEFSVCVPKE